MFKSGVAIVIILTAFAAHAAAQKCKFTVAGDWDLQQANRILVKVSLRQNGDKVTGLASYMGMKQGHPHSENGDITGTFYPTESSGKYRLELDIRWDYGETGIYTGWVTEQYNLRTGRSEGKWKMRGGAYIKEDPNNAARMTTWRFLQDLPCRQ